MAFPNQTFPAYTQVYLCTCVLMCIDVHMGKHMYEMKQQRPEENAAATAEEMKGQEYHGQEAEAMWMMKVMKRSRLVVAVHRHYMGFRDLSNSENMIWRATTITLVVCLRKFS